MKRVFLLSPASCSGERARLVLRGDARFDLALRLRSRDGAALGEVFSFLSGLYFRGKLAYANAFARPPDDMDGVLVITPSRGAREDTYPRAPLLRPRPDPTGGAALQAAARAGREGSRRSRRKGLRGRPAGEHRDRQVRRHPERRARAEAEVPRGVPAAT